jgi:hypothetical protein
MLLNLRAVRDTNTMKGHDVNQLKYIFSKHYVLTDISKMFLDPMQKKFFFLLTSQS